MNISEPFIRRPVMTTLVMITFAFFGLIAFRFLPMSDMPDIEFPAIMVTVTYPGADPLTIANNVVSPLEKQFTTLDGVQTISSSSTTGGGNIILLFNLDRDIDSAATDVLAAINAASAQLPQDLPYTPTFSKVNPTSTPILFFAVTSNTMKEADLYTYADSVLGERLNIIDGVSQVETYGSSYAVRIQVDPQKLAARGIGIDEFAQAIQNANVYLPTGTLFGQKTEYTINCLGQLTKGEDYVNLIIKNENGLITRLGDVASALDSLWNDKYYIRYLNKEMDQPMVGLAIQKQSGANTVETINRIKEKLPSLLSEIPSSIQVRSIYDQSEYIAQSVSDVEVTLLIALILVVLVIFVYLGKPVNTIIPSTTIPISILGAFIVMHLLGYSLDIFSLLSITLAIGFLVDDAIVVLENIARHVEEGADRFTASLNGSKQIGFTILSMTTSLCAIFIPLLFMGGVVGRILHEFAVTFITAILISGMVSLSLTPMLCSRFISSFQIDKKLNKIERFSAWLNHSLLSWYQPTLTWALKHKKTVFFSAFFSLAGSLFLFAYLPKDFLPNDDIGWVQGFAQSPDGTSPFETATIAKQLGHIAMQNPAVEQLVTLGAAQQDNQTLFYLRLKDIHLRPPMTEVLKSLNADFFDKMIGVQVFLKPVPLVNLQVGAQASKSAYQYTLQSLDSKTLYESALALEQKMRTLKEITSVGTDMDISQPQLRLEINRDKAALYGITAQQIEQTLSLAYASINLSPINKPEDQYYVIMETTPQFYKDPSMLSQLWIRSSTGNLVPFNEVVTAQETVGPLTINHINGLPAVNVSFDLAEDVALETGIAAIETVSRETLPGTIFGTIQGAANIFKKSFANLDFLLFITIFVVYIILGILYENFFHPLTVMSTLPPAALGGLLTLLLFGFSLSLYAFVGLIMLLGIVMKNGIIMIDFANEAVEKGDKTPYEAIFDACSKRFRPIIMTTIAAIMGALPIAFGLGGVTAYARKPLGVVIVGGLIFSQILTLYLTPVTYLYVEIFREKLKKKKMKEA